MKRVDFKKLSIVNFLSVGEDPVTIEFSKGLHVITGKNKDKPDRRNAIGKSTIADALYFAIFGETLRELKKDLIPNNLTNGKTHIELDFEVPETALLAIKKGIEVIAKTRAYKSEEFIGKIKTVNTRINPLSRSITVRALFSNTRKLLKPGMFMVVKLPIITKENSIIIPEESIISDGNKTTVYIYEDGVSIASDVKLGERLEGEVEILKGLKGDEYLVVGGVQKIRDRQKVQPIN